MVARQADGEVEALGGAGLRALLGALEVVVVATATRVDEQRAFVLVGVVVVAVQRGLARAFVELLHASGGCGGGRGLWG